MHTPGAALEFVRDRPVMLIYNTLGAERWLRSIGRFNLRIRETHSCKDELPDQPLTSGQIYAAGKVPARNLTNGAFPPGANRRDLIRAHVTHTRQINAD